MVTRGRAEGFGCAGRVACMTGYGNTAVARRKLPVRRAVRCCHSPKRNARKDCRRYFHRGKSLPHPHLPGGKKRKQGKASRQSPTMSSPRRNGRRTRRGHPMAKEKPGACRKGASSGFVVGRKLGGRLRGGGSGRLRGCGGGRRGGGGDGRHGFERGNLPF